MTRMSDNGNWEIRESGSSAIGANDEVEASCCEFGVE